MTPDRPGRRNDHAQADGQEFVITRDEDQSTSEPRSGWWRHTALRLRAALAFGLTALVLSVVLAGTTYALLRSSLLDERATAAERQAYTNARLLRSRVEPLPPNMSQLLAGLQVGPDGGALLEIDGQWFSSSVSLTPSELPEQIGDMVEGGDAATQRFRLGDEPVLGVGVPINAVGASYFEVTSLAGVESSLDRLGRTLATAALIATVVGAALGAALSSIVLQPLRRFAAVATRIAGGETTTRLDAAGDPDLEPLAGSFNEMLDELDERIERERRFASDVSHEIRGPVAALASAVSIVDRRRDQLPAEVVPVVDALDEQVKAFNQLVLDLLEISRFDARTAALETASTDIAELCRDLVDGREEQITVRSLHDGPIRAEVDRRRLEQVLTNLLDNADHYAGGATDIVVGIGSLDGAGAAGDGAPAADGSAVAADGSAVAAGGSAVTAAAFIRVEDRGPGVSDAERDEIFARFRRGSAADSPGAPRGTGLGLALSAQHITLHGGRLWVEDRDGGGACFVIELPRTRSSLDGAAEGGTT